MTGTHVVMLGLIVLAVLCTAVTGYAIRVATKACAAADHATKWRTYAESNLQSLQQAHAAERELRTAPSPPTTTPPSLRWWSR